MTLLQIHITYQIMYIHDDISYNELLWIRSAPLQLTKMNQLAKVINKISHFFYQCLYDTPSFSQHRQFERQFESGNTLDRFSIPLLFLIDTNVFARSWFIDILSQVRN